MDLRLGGRKVKVMVRRFETGHSQGDFVTVHGQDGDPQSELHKDAYSLDRLRQSQQFGEQERDERGPPREAKSLPRGRLEQTYPTPRALSFFQHLEIVAEMGALPAELRNTIQAELATFLASASSAELRARAARRLVRRGLDALPFLFLAWTEPNNREMSRSIWRLIEDIYLNRFEHRPARE
jgi:hypothetical protein